MAEAINKCVFLLIAVFACEQNGRGWALDIQISPDKIDPINPTAVNISCNLRAPFDQEAKEIMILQITKQGHRPIVSLRPCCDIPDKTKLQEYVQAIGHIDKVPSQSYLRLYLLDPKERDTGLYQCTMYFLDDFGFVEEKRSEANLTLEDMEMTSLVSRLVHKVSELDDELKNHKDVQTNLTKQVVMLKSKLKKQVSEHKEIVKELRSNISLSDDKLEKQNLKILELESRTNIHERKETELKSNISMLEEKFQTQVSKQSYVSAFSATYSVKGSENIGDTIAFNEVILKMGKDYDEKTGLFTASKSGVYGFHLVAMVSVSNGYLVLGLHVNDKKLAECAMSSEHYLDQSSNTVFVQLKTNDVVKVKVIGKMSKMGLRTDLTTIFTGYLFRQTGYDTLT